MCGRTALFAPQSYLEDRFDAEASEPIVPRYNIAPQDDLAVVKNTARDTIDQIRWGLIPFWADEPGSGMINARAETVDEKPSFKNAYESRRCLVLSNGFYEWDGSRGSKQPYYLYRPDNDVFAMAGIWETWSENGEEIESVAIITTEANETVSSIHDRMPVILEEEEESEWIAESPPDNPESLLDPLPADQLTSHKVSPEVNNPANDRASLIEQYTDPQSGLGEFT